MDRKHDKIWLRPGNWDGEECWCWCEDIAPFIDDEEDEADGPYIHADVLRKLVERIKDKADDAYAGMEHRRYAAYRECADELEAVLNNGGE